MPLRKVNFARLLLGSVVLLLPVSMMLAQDQEGMRKATVQIKPAYPDLAKRMNVSGIVKIEVSVAPNGEVKDSKAIGGNPVLIQAAETAVKRWKFEPASKASTEVVTFRFNPE
jgi:TonB family protein